MHKLVIVEDDTVVATAYRMLLQRRGYSVQVAHDALAGWDCLQAFQPELLLLDLVLPQVSGIEFLKRIRAVERYACLPVVALTNAYYELMIKQAAMAGANRVLDKGRTSPEVLVNTIEECISEHLRAAAA